MPSQITLWTGLIGIGATIVLIQPAVAKSPIEIGDTAKAITVLITEPNSQGSGVILQRQGDVYTILTAAHVVRAKTKYKITTSDDRSYEVISSSIRPATGNIDLAVVKFKSTATYPTAKLGNCNLLKIGMDLYVAGFPATTRVLTQSLLVFREGKVSANSNKSFDAGYSLVYSNDTLPGMSGGAVLNSEGELVAIHGRGDRQERNNGEIGAKTGFNVGIPINRFATVAKNMGIELGGQVAPIPQNTAPKADDYIASAQQKYIKQDYRGSLVELNRAIQFNPNLTIAYNYRGRLKEDKLQNIQGALADYNRAIQLDSNYAIAYNNRGGLKAEKLQDIQGALADYNRAIQLDPNYAIAYNNRGGLKAEKLQDIQGGLADYNRAIQLDSNYAIAYYNRGRLKRNKIQDIQGALADYNRAIQLDPNFANALNNRGLLKAEKLQDIQGALADYNRAIQLDPKDAITYHNRGLLKAEKLQDVQGGLADYNRAIQLNPNYGDAYNNRGVLKVGKLQDVQGGLADYNRAIQLDPNDPNTYVWRGLLKYNQLKDLSGGITDLQKAAKLFQQQGSTQDYQLVIDQLKKWGAASQTTGF
jgi:tetratricopeptide (TPR) repeat protein